MYQRCRLFILTIVIFLGMSATVTANATQFSVDDMKISLAPGYSICQGIWIANSRDHAFLLLGSENENVMKVAIASQSSDEQYEMIALSEEIITYEEYCICLLYTSPGGAFYVPATHPLRKKGRQQRARGTKRRSAHEINPA